MSTGFCPTSVMRESMIPPFSATPMSEKTRNRWGDDVDDDVDDDEDDDDDDDDDDEDFKPVQC